MGFAVSQVRMLALACALLALPPAFAQNVSLAGSMGDKALLVIDGRARTLAPGGVLQGVTLVSLRDGVAVVEIDGRRAELRAGAAPVNLGGEPSAGTGTRVVLSAGPGGHFLSLGSINGHTVRFMVDTGATMVAIGQAEAQRIGLSLRDAPRGMVNTANGRVPAYRLRLDVVRLGDVQVYNVDAVVLPAAMPHVLLGNSFLARFRMQRENDRLVLDKRR